MKKGLTSQGLLALVIAALLFLFPGVARADSINIDYVAMVGAAVLAPLLAFEVFVEAAFLAIGLKVPYRKVLLVALAMNLASLAAGIPVKIFNAWMYTAILPQELAPYFREYPRAVCLGTAIFFLATLLVESLVVIVWRRRLASGAGWPRAVAAVVLANAATYAVLGPLHYWTTKPTHNIREFTDDTRWAPPPHTTLYYIEQDTGNLCSIRTDGQGKQVLIADTVKDYQLRTQQGWFLYRNGSDELCLVREEEKKPRVCWQAKQPFMMDQVACSPDGRMVAYLESLTAWQQPYRLVVYDVDSGRTIPTEIKTHENEPMLAWSNDPAVVFLEHSGKIEAFRIGKDGSATPAELDSVDQNMLVVYGRFRKMGYSRGSAKWGPTFWQDITDGTQATTYFGLESHLQVKTRDGNLVILTDNPGLLHLPSRSFGDVCLVGNGQQQAVVFDDHRDIYLLDIHQRKVGWIAHGSRVITLTARYQRNLGEKK